MISRGAERTTTHARTPSTPVPTPPTSPPSTPVTGPPPVTQPTAIVQWPDPYQPTYDTVASLVDDAAVVTLATLGPPSGTGYELDLKRVFSPWWPPIPIAVGSNIVTAAHLRPGATYVFFWAEDTADHLTCTVGGIRGVMAYDAATDTVTRLDHDSDSQIPRSQTLKQLQTAVQAATTIQSTQPITNPPPACASSATGLTQ